MSADPAVEVIAEPADDAIVKAYRIAQYLNDGEIDHAYYSWRYAEQVGPHILDWLKDKPGCEITVSIEEIEWAEWRDTYLGEPADLEVPE